MEWLFVMSVGWSIMFFSVILGIKVLAEFLCKILTPKEKGEKNNG